MKNSSLSFSSISVFDRGPEVGSSAAWGWGHLEDGQLGADACGDGGNGSGVGDGSGEDSTRPRFLEFHPGHFPRENKLLEITLLPIQAKAVLTEACQFSGGNGPIS